VYCGSSDEARTVRACPRVVGDLDLDLDLALRGAAVALPGDAVALLELGRARA
jgi:hypothetical protein